MRLCDLLPECELRDEVTGLSDDSARVRGGNLFFALAGSRRHGLDFSPQAQDNGAVALVYDPKEGTPPEGLVIPCIAVEGLAARMSGIAARFYGHPSRRLEVIGITGTNGKTSCSVFLAQILDGAVSGTLGWGRWPRLEPTVHTTAPAIETQRRLHALALRGIETLAMEVSSHALDQGRVNAVDFDLALWTNLSRDHLDYHGSMEAYAASKRKLLLWPGLKAVVLNLDDPRWERFAQGIRAPLFGFGWRQGGQVAFPYLAAGGIRFLPDCIEFQVRLGKARERVRLPLLGECNLANALAVMTVLVARGADLAAAAAAVSTLRPVPGRMERFQRPGRPLVVVDYAHTPAALETALRSLRRHVNGRLWLVFGCGGDRDRGKRPQMGQVAEKLADRIIVTDDNPRGEDPVAIAGDIVAGMGHPPEVIHDRALAVETAIGSANANDIVLVAGKGHEAYQEAAGERSALCDRDLVAALLGREAAPCV